MLACLSALDGGVIVRLAAPTFSETERDGWVELRLTRQRAGRMRCFSTVRTGNSASRQATIWLHRHRKPDGSGTTWYIVTHVEGDPTRLVAYAGRWWQACMHTRLKSGFCTWEGGRVTHPPRGTMLRMGFGWAGWVLWLLGRSDEQTAQRTPTTTKSQPRRRTIITWGWDILRTACTRRKTLERPRRQRPACSMTSVALQAPVSPALRASSNDGNSHICLSCSKQRLRAFILRCVSDEAAAEDILQDVFLKIHTRLASLQNHDRLEA